MDDLLNEFLTETAESIDVVDVEVVKLEQDPNNKAVLDNIFRLVHTIKGTCGFLGLPRLEKVAHSSENVLGKFRDGELEVTGDAITVVLESLDRIKEILHGLEATEEEPAGDDSELISRLDAIAAGEKAVTQKNISEAKTTGKAQEKTETVEEAVPAPARELKPGEVSLEELEAVFQATAGPDADEGENADGTTGNVQNDLFDKFGGEDATTVVGHLVANHLDKDEKLSEFFASDDENVRKARFVGLLTTALEGDAEDAATIAASMISAPGFGDEQFDLLTGQLKAVLNEMDIEAEISDDVLMGFEIARAPMIEQSQKLENSKAEQSQLEAEQKAQAGTEPSRSSQSIRVSVDLLEDLMNMVSELVLTRNQLLQMVRQMDDSEFTVPLQRLSQCTTELQEGVMKTRMQPIGNAWAKLPRIIRDLSVELDKKIELDMRGAETELDRQVLELIKDPLTHMVRNSADHGLETPAERLAAGKPETGTVRLNAFHEGGHIIIGISDDGRGLSTKKLRAKAKERGLFGDAELEEMSDGQIHKLIFHAGFSTAEKVTSVSGRGVGMDVVRSNIEKIGGTIDMNSKEGKGTTFQIKIPLTLAIVSALIVEATGERFAIPQISVLELVRASANSEHKVERIKDTPVLRLRNRLLPLVYMNKILGLSDGVEEEKTDDAFIVVTQVGASTFGIVVDQVFDTEEIVVKPVAPILKEISVYSGNTILGDGSVIMILDPNGIAVKTSTNVTEDAADERQTKAVAASVQDKETLMVFLAGTENQKAVPLSLVARLEDIEVDKIETSDGQPMVQYRGALMPLVLVNQSNGFRTEGRQPVLVFSDNDRSMGLAVDEILDIVEDQLEIELSSDNQGMVGSAIINGKATEIIDVAYYLKLAYSDWMNSQKAQTNIKPVENTSVLLVDDSSFFRNMLKPLLSVAGYKVTTVNTAAEALKLRDQGADFDLIISDIDMPEMDGFEFAQNVREDGRWRDKPLVALSSFAGDQHFTRGREVGFNDYVVKLDRDALLISLAQQLKIHGDAA